MRSRVALPAALIALMSLVLLSVYSAFDIASEVNEHVASDLRDACENIGVFTSRVDMDRRIEIVANLCMGDGESWGLFQSDRTALYASDDAIMLPRGISSSSTRQGTVRQVIGKDAEGQSCSFAVYEYADGTFLVISTNRLTVFSWILDNPFILVLLLTLVGAAILLLYVWSLTRRQEELVRNTMHALDEMADGNFDARLPGISGKEDEINEYNAILGRIQTRIFNQQTRNTAIGVIMNQMQNGIVAVDQDLNIMLITPMAKKFLGLVGNVEGKPIKECLKDVNLDSVFEEAMQYSGVYTNEVAARTTVGRGRRPLRLYVSPMRDGQKVVGALAMVEDITELKRLEQVRTDFAANVSHELKTPLTSIRGFVETLEAGAIDNPDMAHKFLRIIMLETERLTRLINDILSISKLESGSDEVAIERIRLDKVAYDVCDMLSIHAAEKKVTLHSRLNSTPVYIMGNPDRVEQMLINLIENGIKYNKEGGSVTVQVFANKQEANVTISDTGIGIAEEHLPRMFERFYRVDKGRSRAMGGTGLGLAIVKHIVHSMNGEIEVQSKLGEGTEFLITLPMAPKDNPDKDTIFND